MKFKIPLTLEVSVTDPAEKDKYVDASTGEATLDYLADLFDENILEAASTYPNAQLVSINGKSQAEIKLALATRVP